MYICFSRGKSEQEGGVAYSLRQKTVERREPQKVSEKKKTSSMDLEVSVWHKPESH